MFLVRGCLFLVLYLSFSIAIADQVPASREQLFSLDIAQQPLDRIIKEISSLANTHIIVKGTNDPNLYSINLKDTTISRAIAHLLRNRSFTLLKNKEGYILFLLSSDSGTRVTKYIDQVTNTQNISTNLEGVHELVPAIPNDSFENKKYDSGYTTNGVYEIIPKNDTDDVVKQKYVLNSDTQAGINEAIPSKNNSAQPTDVTYTHSYTQDGILEVIPEYNNANDKSRTYTRSTDSNGVTEVIPQ